VKNGVVLASHHKSTGFWFQWKVFHKTPWRQKVAKRINFGYLLSGSRRIFRNDDWRHHLIITFLSIGL